MGINYSLTKSLTLLRINHILTKLFNCKFSLLQAEYLDLKEWFSTVTASTSPSNTFIQAVIVTEHPTVSTRTVKAINNMYLLDINNFIHFHC
jgi:hypothetical protein